ncbi:hypothetical protein C8R26_110118, partial [Nitrosomonas oligotropha]
KRSLYVCSSLQPLPGLVRHVGFGKLKNLANQEKYNEEVSEHDLGQIDEPLVYVRNALAHGRISANETNDTLRLIMFSRPKEKRVTVLFNEKMTEAWFVDQYQIVDAATKLVANAILVICSSVKISQTNETP